MICLSGIVLFFPTPAIKATDRYSNLPGSVKILPLVWIGIFLVGCGAQIYIKQSAEEKDAEKVAFETELNASGVSSKLSR